MAKTIENLTLRAIECLVGDGHRKYMGDDLFLTMSAHKFGKHFLQTGLSYQVADGRVMQYGHCIITQQAKPQPKYSGRPI